MIKQTISSQYIILLIEIHMSYISIVLNVGQHT